MAVPEPNVEDKAPEDLLYAAELNSMVASGRQAAIVLNATIDDDGTIRLAAMPQAVIEGMNGSVDPDTKAISFIISAALLKASPAWREAVQDVIDNGVTPAVPGGVPLFKISGQSNAQGLARRSALYATPLSTVNPPYTRQYQTKIWNPTANALQLLQVGTTADGTGNELGQQHPEAPSDYENGHGPELGLAQRLEQEGITNGVIAKFGRGATQIAAFKKSGLLWPLLKATIEDARVAIIAAGGTPVEKAFYWRQFEADLYSTTYYDDLTEFYNDLLDEGLLGPNELFIICASDHYSILPAQQQFVSEHANARLLDPAPFSFIPNDNIHFDSVTQLKLGNKLYNVAYSTTGTIDTTGTPVVADDPLQFPETPNLTYDGDAYITTGTTGTYDVSAISPIVFPATVPAILNMTRELAEDGEAVLGFSVDGVTTPAINNINFGLLLAGGNGQLYKIEQGSFSNTGITLAVGEKARVRRTAPGVVTVDYYTNGAWAVAATIGNTNARLYAVLCAKNSGGRLSQVTYVNV